MLSKITGHADLNHGPLDLQSNALPLSYTPDELLQCETIRLNGAFFSLYKRTFGHGYLQIPHAQRYK